MTKHNMHDCIEKAEAQLREKYPDELITITTENVVSWQHDNIQRECSLEVVSLHKKKNGEYTKNGKKSPLSMPYCPFCGQKNRE